MEHKIFMILFRQISLQKKLSQVSKVCEKGTIYNRKKSCEIMKTEL